MAAQSPEEKKHIIKATQTNIIKINSERWTRLGLSVFAKCFDIIEACNRIIGIKHLKSREKKRRKKSKIV